MFIYIMYNTPFSCFSKFSHWVEVTWSVIKSASLVANGHTYCLMCHHVNLTMSKRPIMKPRWQKGWLVPFSPYAMCKLTELKKAFLYNKSLRRADWWSVLLVFVNFVAKGRERDRQHSKSPAHLTLIYCRFCLFCKN